MDPKRPPRPPAGRLAPRRRHSKRTYVIRRIVVLALLIAVVTGAVAGVRALFSSEESSASSEPPTSAATTLPGASTAVVDATVVEGATSTTAPVVPASSDPNRVPTPADPARVLLLGDSEAGGLGPFLQPVLEDTGVVTMTLDYKVSSGLVRPDFFDWPAHLRQSIPVANPDIVVALFGGNDGQPFLNTTDPVDSAAWRAEYGRRVAEVMELLSADGRTLVWVGVPNAEDESLTAALTVQNEVVKEQAAQHPDVVFVDAWDRFTGLDGGFAPFVADPRDGVFKEVRSQTDGFHLNRIGEEILAFDVSNAVIADLRERGATI